MTANDYSALDFLAKCSGWTEAPLDKTGKIDPRFISVRDYLSAHGLIARHRFTSGGKNGTVAECYKITALGRVTLARPRSDAIPKQMDSGPTNRA